MFFVSKILSMLFIMSNLINLFMSPLL